MTILQSIILGIIEGISEFLPISSTAHLIISGKLLNIVSSDFLNSYFISIQLGAIMSVIVLYARLLWKQPKIIFKIIAAFIPTAIVGFLAYQIIKNYLMENLIIIATALLLGGIALIVLEKYFSKKQKESNDEIKEEKLEKMSYKQAALIGLFQSLAVIPGVSRSAATIMGGLSLGISRKNIVEFSFLLALPTMAAATFFDLYKSPLVLEKGDVTVWIIGFVVSFITAILGIKFFLRYIQKNDFKIFGWYRIIIALAIFAWALI
jgi:undecaprenyl-diphosphatase